MEGVPSARNYDGGFACDLMAKDLSLATSAAYSQAKMALPMGSLAHQLYMLMSARGMGVKDFSGLYMMLKNDEKKE
jgi:3-hydroxyisobutyrate dehydrogenase